MESQIVNNEINDKGEFIKTDEGDKKNSDKGIVEEMSNQGNPNISKNEQNSTEILQTYSFLDIEEFLKNGKIPPGIKEYDDLPSLESCKPSESQVIKTKKPWETDENSKNLNFIEN
jgi:hypothetical protein